MQPLATEATGKAKKYERTGPQEFVPFVFDEVTIPNIIAACNNHFKKRPKGMSCDVLATDRGSSCTKISQLPNLKLIHDGFVVAENELDSSITSNTRGYQFTSSPVRCEASTSIRSKQLPVPRSTSALGVKRKLEVSFRAPPKVPKSLGVTSMMKLGQAITATETSQEIIEVSKFNISDMVWSPPVSAHFTIENEAFADGGFRAAYRATSNSPNFEDKTYVVKRFLPKTIELIATVNETQDDHARKSIQMQALADNFASQIASKVDKDGNKNVYGKCFRYVDAFLGKILSTNEIVTVEEFASGTFQKYVNNDGSLSRNSDTEKQGKAESLVHFSFAKSNKKLLLVDIQGGGYDLTDPEIATVGAIYDDNHHLLFCAGNLSTEAYLHFFTSHECGVFCNLLGLIPEEMEGLNDT